MLNSEILENDDLVWRFYKLMFKITIYETLQFSSDIINE